MDKNLYVVSKISIFQQTFPFSHHLAGACFAFPPTQPLARARIPATPARFM
ncbi:hypothetical protein EC970264_0924 [Escherichia coli 97.0264]|nr:hypothetical protein EC970264_0924 [Escherichia coli 97.0264]